MKCDLAGFLLNASSLIVRMTNGEEDDPELQVDYYAASLREVAEDIQRVRNGEAPLQDLLDYYCLNPGDCARPVEPPNG